MIKRTKISIDEIRKFVKKNGFNITKEKKSFFKEKNLDVFSKTVLSSLIVVSFFTIMPIVINFTKERALLTQEFKNNSKNNFTKTLEGKNYEKLSKIDNELNQKYLFDDVLNFEDLPDNTVRLSASTIKQLFLDTGYNLSDVRKKKLVKPVSLSLLPVEIKMIENTKERKELFIQIILPLVIKENNNIKLDRIKLFGVLNKNKNTNNEKNWLEKKFKQYGVINKDLSTLKIRLDEIPISMAIAQAAKETGWGTSRFAQEGNALFGQWT